MLKITNWEVFGLPRAIHACRNPFRIGPIPSLSSLETEEIQRSEARAKQLGSVSPGLGHDHFLAGIHVIFDIQYPQYWAIEAQRYHWFTIISSQSKMHTLTARKTIQDSVNKYVEKDIIKKIDYYLYLYDNFEALSFKDGDQEYLIFSSPGTGETIQCTKYELFMRILSNLPMGFELWMTCDLSYLQLKTIVLQRKNHKLKEDWGEFCRWAVQELPMFKELTGVTLDNVAGIS